jgi:hypothetical protein
MELGFGRVLSLQSRRIARHLEDDVIIHIHFHLDFKNDFIIVEFNIVTRERNRVREYEFLICSPLAIIHTFDALMTRMMARGGGGGGGGGGGALRPLC